MASVERVSIHPKPRRGGTTAIYARSAADDDGGRACRRQVRAACEAASATSRAMVYADAGRSGMNGDRPGLRRLLGDAGRGMFDRVQVRDLARLARSCSLLVTILNQLRAAGVEVVTIGKEGGDA